MLSCIIFIWFFSQVNCLNEILRGESVLYGLSSLAKSSANSSSCEAQLHLLFEAVNVRQVWSLKALDASGSPGTGFIYGNNLWIGSHAQCNDISNTKKFQVNYEKIEHANATPYDYPPYPMAFYMFYILHNNTLQYHHQLAFEFTIQLGLCLPKFCSPQDLTEMFNYYLKAKYLNIQNLYDLNLSLTEIKPLREHNSELLKLPKTIILISITGIVLLFALCGTIYDVRQHNWVKKCYKDKYSVQQLKATDPSTVGKILKCFSIYSNAKNLMKTKQDAGSIPIIHGLRVFTAIWATAVHSSYYGMEFIENMALLFRMAEDIFTQAMSNGSFAVDTFLFISGFLVAYLYLNDKKHEQCDTKQRKDYLRKISEFFMKVLGRFLRLTPLYIMVILLTDCLYTYYRQTSSLTLNERADITCSKYWWSNILYINNLFPTSESCLVWSWYLAVDTQFYIISIFLLILSTIAFNISAILLMVLLLGSIAATAYKAYSMNYKLTMDEQLTNLDTIYKPSWYRIGPYFVGVITAYIFVIKLKKKLVLSERTRILLWILFPLINLWILYGIADGDYSLGFSAFYTAISRPLWGVGLAWLLVACCTGNARAVEKFLSFKGFIPLSKLTYCVYLLNPIVYSMIYVAAESNVHASKSGLTLYAFGGVLITFLLSFIISLLFEIPFVLLTKLFLKKRKAKPKQTSIEGP